MAGMKLEELQAQLSGLGQYEKKTEEELRAQSESLYKSQYEQNLKLLQESILSGIAQQQRDALDRGMQRSSYNQAQQAIIRGQGLNAQAQLGTDYSTNVANALLNMLNTEYERETDANRYRDQLIMSLYEYGNRGGGGNNTQNPTESNPSINPFAGLNSLFGGNNSASTSGSGIVTGSVATDTIKKLLGR